MTSDTNTNPHAAAAPNGRLHRFAVQLERRRVSRTALSYVLIMWFNVQIGDVLFPMFDVPEWALCLVVIIGVMGIPLVLFLAWTFQITPHGIKVDIESQKREIPEPDRGYDVKINIAMLLLGLTLAGLLVAEITFADDAELQMAPRANHTVMATPRLVTSVSFHPADVRAATLALVEGVEAEVRHQLIRMPEVTVIADNEPTATSARAFMLSGTLYIDDAQVHALVHLLDVAKDEYVWTTAFDLPNTSPLAAETATADRIAHEIGALLNGRTEAPRSSARRSPTAWVNKA